MVCSVRLSSSSSCCSLSSSPLLPASGGWIKSWVSSCLGFTLCSWLSVSFWRTKWSSVLSPSSGKWCFSTIKKSKEKKKKERKTKHIYLLKKDTSKQNSKKKPQWKTSVGTTHGSVNFLFLNFKRVKERKGYKGSISELKNGCCWTVQLQLKGWVQVHRGFLCCRTSLLLSTRHAMYARQQWKLLLLICLWYIPTDFLFPVVVCTDTQSTHS